METGQVVASGTPDEVRRDPGRWPPTSAPARRPCTCRARRRAPTAHADDPWSRIDGSGSRGGADMNTVLQRLGETATRWNPVRAVHRSWRRFARRPGSMQVRRPGRVVVITGLVVYLADAPDGSSTPSFGGVGTGAPSVDLGGGRSARLVSDVSARRPAQPARPARPLCRRRDLVVRDTGQPGQHEHPRRHRHVASTSSSRSSNLDSAGRRSSASPATPSSASRPRRSTSSSSEINDAGGINGRKINPIIVNFDPTNEAAMRALCKDWTEGSPAGSRCSTGWAPGPATTSCASPRRATRRFIGAVDDGDQLDPAGRAVPVVDRPRPGRDPRRRWCSWGQSAGPARHEQQGRDHRRRPGQRPAGAQPVPAARPAQGRDHRPRRRDHRRRTRRDTATTAAQAPAGRPAPARRRA